MFNYPAPAPQLYPENRLCQVFISVYATLCHHSKNHFCVFLYIYVLGNGGWPSHGGAFDWLSCYICTVLPCKLLFLQHKLTDISSIKHKKVL